MCGGEQCRAWRMERHELSEEQWQRIAPLLPAERGRRARPAKLGNRPFINAVLYIAKTGTPWRDLPERFGPWKTVHSKFSRWNARGVFDEVMGHMAREADHESSIVDASYVRAHQHSAGAKGGHKRKESGARAEDSRPRSTPSWMLSVIRSTYTSRPAMSPMSARRRVSSARHKVETSSPTRVTTPTQSSQRRKPKG